MSKAVVATMMGLALSAALGQGTAMNSSASRVDFSYAFGLPHRMTVALPDSSDKTLIDTFNEHLQLRWTYGNLRTIPVGAFMPLGSSWSGDLWVESDGRRLSLTSHRRAAGILPALAVVAEDAEDADGRVALDAVGGKTAGLLRLTVTNSSDKPHRYQLVFSVNGGFGEVPGYINAGDPLDYVLAGWNDRADRVLALLVGGQAVARRETPARTMALALDLKPGETGHGWLVRPYKAYEADVAKLRGRDWAAEFAAGEQAWRDLLGRATRFVIPDTGVRDAYYACLGDLFIMREPVGAKYVAISPGTEAYRCPNSGEASMASVGLDQAGLPREAEEGYRWSIDSQGANGDWNDPAGWSHRCWGMAGFKAWTVLEHYLITRDRAYLEHVWPHLLANSRWQETQRQKTRQLVDGQKPLHYGLMPRGQGDCGLDAGDGWYGYFIPHNAWAVNADRVAMLAAGYLGHTAEQAELRGNFERAKADLISSMDRGAIAEDGYRWIPGSPGNRAGSRWGVLNAAFPCEVLPPDHELISGTLRYMARQMSPGGLHVHTGWMADGMWVAISLDNVAEVELRRGNGDEAARLLYACLNHGTPLLTWCEERGPKPGTDQVSGDRQHLWTPAAVVRAVRDVMVMEDGDGLRLAAGADRGWLGSGQPVGVEQAPTHFGPVSYAMAYDAARHQVAIDVTFPRRNPPAWVELAVRLPEGLKIKSFDAASGASLAAGGEALRWTRPKGAVKVVATVGTR